MWCTTECWSCEDKTCEHYIDKTQLYFKSKQLEEEINRLNKELIKKDNILNEIRKAFTDNNIHNNMELVRKIKTLIGSDNND